MRQRPQLLFDRSLRIGWRDPFELRQLIAKPRRLPLGVLAGFQFGVLDRFLKRDLAGEMTDQPRHAMRLHRRQIGIELARRQRAHFIKRAGRHHGVEARIDAAQQFVAIGHQKDFGRASARSMRRRLVFLVPVQNRAAGRQHHFQRAA